VLGGRPYDSVDRSAGANGHMVSGVAAMLALSRPFADRTPDRTLRFVAFVTKSLPIFNAPTMGSLVYARR